MATTSGWSRCRAVSVYFKVFLCFLVSTSVSSKQKDSFTEELLIKPLSRGYIYSHFQFTTKWNASLHDPTTFHHFHLFPKALGEVLSRYNVQELHLSQTQGLWRHKQWGYPVHDAPPGAELWVWFRPSVKDVDKAWTELVNAVSGLFCSSLNFLDSRSTIAPRWSFRPAGLAPQGYSVSSHFVRYGTLPREIVCTENLTPWKKLLPCDSKAGLSTLFNAFHFHDANYHSLGLHVRPISPSNVPPYGLFLTTTFFFHHCLQMFCFSCCSDWSLRSLFGNHLASACPIASKTSIMVETTDNEASPAYRLTPTPTWTHTVTRGTGQHTYSVYNVRSFTEVGRGLNIAGTYNDPSKVKELDPPPIHAHRYITGYGLEDGGVSCLITNTLDRNQTVIYMDVLPWFTRVFFNSLTVQNNGLDVPFKVHFTPAKDRVRPYHLELSFNLWPHSVTRVSFSFTRAFLKWTEYPPDANHGFYIGSAVISSMLPTSRQYSAPPLYFSKLDTILNDNSSSYLVRVHSESLVVSLPTPDFSMPYNVICLACTVVAIAFGSIHNLTTRRFVKLDPSQRKGLLSKVKGFFKRSKKEDEVADDSNKTAAAEDAACQEKEEDIADPTEETS
ncbi:GPI transamidase component PIG-T [Aplysia californica]|uniref:GPI transamidase component PIG-T n=1 Tax=Aplysia californica TaxID=6500 RepID=A0ABM1VX67_APLCA|nr:GPI transamidase component PIG-T [Aplysia californica]